MISVFGFFERMLKNANLCITNEQQILLRINAYRPYTDTGYDSAKLLQTMSGEKIDST